jgi:protein-L-isoaspartate(D-aspartate) O-methyltransferase
MKLTSPHVLKTACRLLPAACLIVGIAHAEPKSPYDGARQRMVDEEIVGGGVKNSRVIEAMRTTPRHEFVPANQRQNAYYDMSIPIGEGQTISGPFVVAYMTEQLDPQPGDKVLEIGTGSGYQAAVLSPLVKDVYSIEILEPLGKSAQNTLKRLKYNNVHVKIGDGYQGWPDVAPFDKIIVTCSPEKVPQPLIDELKEGGRMIVPVGERYQQMLYLFTKKDGKLVSEALRPTLFVPMTGQAEQGRQVQPDPLNPKIVNGSFEEQGGTENEPLGWFYCRQMKIESSPDAPDGKQYLKFTNDVPGRMSRALQGFAIDGKAIGELEVSATIRGRDIRPGQTVDQLPEITLTFYDDNTAVVGRTFLGPYRGTFDWKQIVDKLKVPAKATKCIMHLGLLGGTGEFSIDAVSLKPISR